ncbi:MAG: MFS transporter [Candidatus Aminicenantes bacterium]|jgi:MFS family permease
MTDLKANLWKIYLYKFISEFYLIVPILIPYYKSNALNSTQIFTIQAAYALSILLLEVPSGYLADVIGRKNTLILGAIFMPVGLAIYVFTGSFFTFVCAEFILAVGNSMRSGCDSAFIYDTAIELQAESEYKKYEGRSAFYTRIGTALASVLGGIVALLSLNLPFYINIGSSLLMLPLALALVEPKRDTLESKNPLMDILRIVRFSYANPQLRLLMLFSALILSTGIIGIWSYFLYYESLGISVGYFGILFAAFQLASAVGSRKAHSLEKLLGTKNTLLFVLFIGGVFLLLGKIQSPLMIPLISANAFLWGLSYPLFLDQMNRLIKSETRATVLSIANMTGSLSYVILAPLFGQLVDRLTLSKSYLILGIYFLAICAVALFAFFRLFPPQKTISKKNGG